MRKLIIVLLALPVMTMAQDDPKPFHWGGFENSGSTTFGYRFTEVGGYRPSFDQMFGLNSGPRLLDFSLFGKATAEKGNRFADDYSLTASGIGGDPYMTTQLTVRKAHKYDLRVNFRQSHYYFNQNDSLLLSGGFNSLTNNHDWATVRKMGSASLLIHATNNLRFSFEYYRNTRDGVTFTTRPMDYYGSSSAWGSYARADAFYLVAPVNEESNRVTGGIDYTRRSWALHYKLGYQRFTDTVPGTNLGPGQLSINVDDATTRNEPLSKATWTDYRKLSTPVSEFSYTGKLTKDLEARGSYLFYRYSGPASLDFTASGIARTTSATVDAPYTFSMSSRANNSEPNNVIDQGFTYRVKEWWDILADYRYSRFHVNSNATFNSLNGSVVATGTELDQWWIGVSTLDLNMAFTPTSALLVRAGVRLMKSDILMMENGITDPARTRRVKTAWPVLSLHYEPSKKFTVRGDIEQITNGSSYTAITPHIDVGGRLIVRYRPTEKLYVEDTTVIRNRTLLASDYRSTVRSNAGTVNYDIHPKVAIYAGFSYDSFYSSDFANFLRGTAPITNLSIIDQTVNRIWTGGLRIEHVKRFGFNFSGNFVRTTGSAQIAGEPSNYGPQSFPYASGALFYDFPRWGRMTAQLQRTYLLEQIIPGNNFSANMLTIAWTRAF